MKFNFYSILFVASASFVISSCGNSSSEESIDKESLDPTASLNTNFDGKIFSIPSPVQTAMLIKELKLAFDVNMLNSIENSKNYNTEVKQALNLGIYGTDLGYCALYEQKNSALKYLSAVEKLTGQLGLEGAFDKTFMTRFEKNSDNQDSMMVIVSDAFRKADYFLKNAKRKSTSSLILAGGWIESMHFACKMSSQSKNPKIVQRIGEQQQTLKTMIEILEEYNKSKQNDSLIVNLKELDAEFDNIKVEYTYVEPKTDAKNKVTTLENELKVTISPDVLGKITTKINAIRDYVIK
ncbi:MAG: hypothetical protein RIT43_1080 [Bacteroidota bacterium]|jgi:hypothetical protein